MHGEGEARDDAEVPAAAASARPEEVGVVRRVARQLLAGGGDDLDAPQVVAREPELSGRVADATAERQPGDADARARAGRYRHASRRKGGIHVDQARARADDGGLPVRSELDAPEPAHVEHDACGRRVAAVAVTSRPRREADGVLPCPRDRRRDVSRRPDEDDRQRTDSVEARALQEPRLRVRRVGMGDDRPGDRPRELSQALVARSRGRPRDGRAEQPGCERRTARPLHELAPVHGGGSTTSGRAATRAPRRRPRASPCRSSASGRGPETP